MGSGAGLQRSLIPMAPNGQRARLILWIVPSAILVIVLVFGAPPKSSTRNGAQPNGEGSASRRLADPNSTILGPQTPPPDLPNGLDMVRQGLASRSGGEEPAGSSDAEIERRRRWMESFPIQPQYDPTLRFDPDTLAEARGPDNAFSQASPETDYRALVARHGFLSGFHRHPWRESSAFEAFYHLMDSENLTGDTLSLASVFQDLVDYSESLSQDPEAPMTYSSWMVDPATGQEAEVEKPIAYPNGSTRTWARQRDATRESILSWLTDAGAWPERNGALDPDEAMRILERLQTEIDPDSLIDLKSTTPIGFTFDQREEDRLEAGDRLLVN